MADSTLLALDIGKKRIGIARANSIALLAEPLSTLANDELFIDRLLGLIDEHNVSLLIIGSPKNLNDNMTDQTMYTNDFSEKIKAKIEIPIMFQNEALSSVTAKDRLSRSTKDYANHGVDAVAAAVILETFIESNIDRIKQLS